MNDKRGAFNNSTGTAGKSFLKRLFLFQYQYILRQQNFVQIHDFDLLLI